MEIGLVVPDIRADIRTHRHAYRNTPLPTGGGNDRLSMNWWMLKATSGSAEQVSLAGHATAKIKTLLR